MRINELKQKYPEHKFYALRLESNPSDNKYLELSKLEDILDLTKKLGYLEFEMDEESASEINYNRMVDNYVKKLSYKETKEFLEFLSTDEKKQVELRKLCKTEAFSAINLYGLDIKVKYDDVPKEQALQNIALIYVELERLYDEYKKEQKRKETEINDKIHKIILSYKEKYLLAQKQKAKDDIIRDVQMKLKIEFDFDGRTDDRANKSYIKMLYENND